jgi:PhzF family phenazine biosynthesis protein
MQINIYHVDAFTNRLFGGNPAAVCPLNRWISVTTMQEIATENNLSETAFFVPKHNINEDPVTEYHAPRTSTTTRTIPNFGIWV